MAEFRTQGTVSPPGSQRFSITPLGPGQFALVGVIDENAALDPLLSQAAGNRLVLDLGGISFINSLGVRAWIRMVGQAAQANLELVLWRMSEPMVHQLNMIVAARGRAQFGSFFAPYVCEHCGAEESMLLDVQTAWPLLSTGQAPPQTCPECAKAMEFNDFPQRFFLFLTDPR